MKLVLCQLYPEHLSIYADRGNVQVLRQRCTWRGIELRGAAAAPRRASSTASADLYLLGGGQDRDQVLVAQDLQRHRDALHGAIGDGAALLAVCGGYQLVGHRYRGHQGDEIPGIGLLDLETDAGDERMIGNVLLRVRPRRRRRPAHARRLREPRRAHALGPGVRRSGRVLAGHGNDGASGYEGARAERVIGTYVHGPLLPKNPWLADWLIARALERRHGDVALAPLDDALETRAHADAARIAREPA